MPDGSWYAEDAKKIFAPPKDKILTSMEELIQNFMIVTEGPQMPAGEVYFEAENPKGALGFYIVSKGGGVPYRLKIRSPSVLQPVDPAQGCGRLHGPDLPGPRQPRLRPRGVRPLTVSSNRIDHVI
jgi:hypothetical protein